MLVDGLPAGPRKIAITSVKSVANSLVVLEREEEPNGQIAPENREVELEDRRVGDGAPRHKSLEVRVAGGEVPRGGAVREVAWEP